MAERGVSTVFSDPQHAGGQRTTRPNHPTRHRRPVKGWWGEESAKEVAERGVSTVFSDPQHAGGQCTTRPNHPTRHRHP